MAERSQRSQDSPNIRGLMSLDGAVQGRLLGPIVERGEVVPAQERFLPSSRGDELG